MTQDSPWIDTASGKRFHFLSPDPASIDINDIAHALSFLCRFCGHPRQLYTVAEHSVRVSWLVPGRLELKALLHDNGEAYCGDLSSPLKLLLPDYVALEASVRDAIFTKFGLTPGLEPEIIHADRVMRATEARDLMVGGIEGWGLEDVQPLSPSEAFHPCWSSTMAEAEFLLSFSRSGCMKVR